MLPLNFLPQSTHSRSVAWHRWHRAAWPLNGFSHSTHTRMVSRQDRHTVSFPVNVCPHLLHSRVFARRAAAHPPDAPADRLAAVPTDPGFVLHEVTLLRLRALLAEGQGNEASYQEFRDRYRAMARALGFPGHIATAEAMP